MGLFRFFKRVIKPKNPSFKQLYEFRCSCGKRLEDHDFEYLGQTETWERMKMFYDLGNCIIPDGYAVKSRPNGFGKYSDYSLIKIPKGGITRDFLIKKVWN